MTDELLPYYEQELVQLRRLSKEFAEQYPKIAGRLLLTGEACEDPHVERMIEAFAFLAARVHCKLDDDFPELTSSFLEILYPHYLRPFPSASIARFDVSRNIEQLTTIARIDRDTQLQTRGVQGMPCRFSTCYPVTIAPIRVREARIETFVDPKTAAEFPFATATLTMEIEVAGAQTNFAKLRLPGMRFFLDGEPTVSYPLYQALFTQVQAIQVFEPGKTVEIARLSPSALRPVGFGEDEGLLQYDPRSHLGYRLLSEYFAFPEKFLFVDLAMPTKQLAALPETVRRLQFRFVLRDFNESEVNSRLLKSISAETFQLHCTPVINLFQHAGEPIRVTHTRSEYPVIPDSRRPRAFEVYSIDSVSRVEKTPGNETVERLQPFYSINHRQGTKERAFWHATRRRAGIGDQGTEMFISLVDLDFDPAEPKSETLSVELTCTNRDLPSRLSFRHPEGDLFMEGGSIAPVIQFLRKPSSTLRPRLGKGMQWRLISHLALNHMSLAEGGAEALTELLTLYDFSESSFNRRQIDAIESVTAAPTMARIAGNPFPTFVRGMELTLQLDDEKFAGGGAFLFGAVLERFFGLYVTGNSFTQLRVVSKNGQKEIAKWAPRSGESILV